jgi:hypothetical protein
MVNILRDRVCNLKPIVVSNNTAAQQVTGQDNNKQGLIIQNVSTTVDAYVTFNAGSNNTIGAMKIVAGGVLALDFAINEPLYGFTIAAGSSALLNVLEISGFDTFQLLQIKLLELIADNTAKTLAITRANKGIK